MNLARRQRRLALAFVAPTLLLLGAVGLYPLCRTVALAFTDAELDSAPEDIALVGGRNFARLAADPDFRAALGNTFVFALSSVALEFILGLAVALFLNAHFRGRGLVRAAILVPWALPTVISARMWTWMLNDVYGVVNDVLVHRLHLLSAPVAWLAGPRTAMASIVLIDVWKTTPFMALLLLAGLQTLPGDLYEAAHVDGAGRFRRFLHITLPLLKPTILVALVFRTLDALRVFDIVWVTTRGASGTESLGTYAYRQLVEFQDLGYGSALSIAILGTVVLFAGAYVALLRTGDSR